MPEDNLTKDDLMLLMESYRNMITMHKTILDQSSKTIEKLDHITTKQDAISTKQGTVCNSLHNIATKMDGVVGGTSLTQQKLDNHHEKSIETHGKLANKIHLGWIGMGTIILGIIGLVITILSHVPIPLP